MDQLLNNWQTVTISFLSCALMLGITIILVQHKQIKDWREAYGNKILNDILNEEEA